MALLHWVQMKSRILLNESTGLTSPMDKYMKPLRKLGLVWAIESGDAEQQKGAANVYEATQTFKWRRKWQPTPIFWPGESQGQRSLVGCHLWGRTESDMTEAMQQQQTFRSLLVKLSWLLLARCVITSFSTNHLQPNDALQLTISYSYFNSHSNHARKGGRASLTFCSLQQEKLRLRASALLQRFVFWRHICPFSRHWLSNSYPQLVPHTEDISKYDLVLRFLLIALYWIYLSVFVLYLFPDYQFPEGKVSGKCYCT